MSMKVKYPFRWLVFGSSIAAVVIIGLRQNHPTTATSFDINGDGLINAQDLAIVEQSIGTSGGYQQGDLNGDGVISIKDLSIIATRLAPQ